MQGARQHSLSPAGLADDIIIRYEHIINSAFSFVPKHILKRAEALQRKVDKLIERNKYDRILAVLKRHL